MSHTATVRVCVRDVNAFKEVCDRDDMNVAEYDSEIKTHRLFDGKSPTGRSVLFKNWRYPVVFDNEGNCHYDDYNGAWGKVADLDRWKQRYGAVAARNAAVSAGYNHISTSMHGDELTTIVANDETEIRAIFPLHGDSRVDVQGCTGPSCELVTAAITSSLGVVTGNELKSEYFDRERSQERETE